MEAIGEATKTRPNLRIGVVRDADNNAVGAFQSVCNQLHNAGYEPPQSHGTFSNVSPSVGVFIVPDGVECGAIETLCRKSVEGTAAAQCVDQYLECLNGCNAIDSRNEDKSFAARLFGLQKGSGSQSGRRWQDKVYGILIHPLLKTSCVSLVISRYKEIESLIERLSNAVESKGHTSSMDTAMTFKWISSASIASSNGRHFNRYPTWVQPRFVVMRLRPDSPSSPGSRPTRLIRTFRLTINPEACLDGQGAVVHRAERLIRRTCRKQGKRATRNQAHFEKGNLQ